MPQDLHGRIVGLVDLPGKNQSIDLSTHYHVVKTIGHHPFGKGFSKLVVMVIWRMVEDCFNMF